MNSNFEILQNIHENKILTRNLDSKEKREELKRPKIGVSPDTDSKPLLKRRRSGAIDSASYKWWDPIEFESNDYTEYTPLQMAITNQHLTLAIDLLNQEPSSIYKAMLFIHAVKHGCINIVKFMIKDKWDINEYTIWNRVTPLITAIIYKQQNIALALIAYGADLEHQDHLGRTPLMYAAMTCNIKMTKLLIDIGANIFATDNKGDTIITLLKKEIDNAKSNQENFTEEENKKIIIYTYLLKYLNSLTKYRYKIDNRAMFSNEMAKHLALKFDLKRKNFLDFFPKDICCIVFSYLDTKTIWLLWALSSSNNLSPKNTYTPSVLSIIKAHTAVVFFAMPTQPTSIDSQTESQVNHRGENP